MEAEAASNANARACATVRLTDAVCVFAGTTTIAPFVGSGIGVSVAEIIRVSAPALVSTALLVSAQFVPPITASTNGLPPAPEATAHIASGALPMVAETFVVSTWGLVPAAVPYGRPTTPFGKEAGTPVNAYSCRITKLFAVPLGALVPAGTTVLPFCSSALSIALTVTDVVPAAVAGPLIVNVQFVAVPAPGVLERPSNGNPFTMQEYGATPVPPVTGTETFCVYARPFTPLANV